MNKVVHFEIPFDDAERAKKFYGEVFDWGIQDMPEVEYIIAHTAETDENFMVKEPGAINGGLYKRSEGLAQSPVLVIDVESIDEHLGKIAEAGGKITREKTEVGDMGLYAQVEDTEGNIIGIWEDLQKKE